MTYSGHNILEFNQIRKTLFFKTIEQKQTNCCYIYYQNIGVLRNAKLLSTNLKRIHKKWFNFQRARFLLIFNANPVFVHHQIIITLIEIKIHLHFQRFSIFLAYANPLPSNTTTPCQITTRNEPNQNSHLVPSLAHNSSRFIDFPPIPINNS